MEDPDHYDPVFFSLTRKNHKQHLISHSSFGAQTITADDNDDMEFHVKETMMDICPYQIIHHEFIVESKELFDTITSNNSNRAFRLRKCVVRLRASIESGKTNAIRWVSSKENFSDAPTRNNIPMWVQLNARMKESLWKIEFSNAYPHWSLEFPYLAVQ